MKKLTLSLFFLLLPFIPSLALAQTSIPSALPSKVSLKVPFVWEIPDGVWVPPWSGACEEAAMTAVDQFYLNSGKRILPKAEAKADMLPIFSFEDKLFGYNGDTDAAEIAKAINDFSSFDATIVRNPTLSDIKSELAADHPVLSLHYGYALNNPRHRFRRGGSSYHVMTLTGYDDATGQFTVNDSELSDGIDYHYKYDIILATLHDFNHKTKHADGPPTVIFTRAKTIVKAAGSARIYLVRDGVKHYISNPAVLKNHRISWKLVKTIDKATLNSFTTGDPINN